MNKLSGFIGDAGSAKGGKTIMREIEDMRGKLDEYPEFAKYRRDFTREEGKAKETGDGGGMPTGGM
jgi:hypothetical protein